MYVHFGCPHEASKKSGDQILTKGYKSDAVFSPLSQQTLQLQMRLNQLKKLPQVSTSMLFLFPYM